MVENQLGKNIQHLRKIYGETQEDLGSILFLAKNTITGYEKGYSRPTPETLEIIAKHYGKTIDELLNVDLSELKEMELEKIVNYKDGLEKLQKILPIQRSVQGQDNRYFAKAMHIIDDVLKSFERGDGVNEAVIYEAYENFECAAEVVEEAVPNMVWCIFLLGYRCTDLKEELTMQSRMLSKRMNYKELNLYREKQMENGYNIRMQYVRCIDRELYQLIKSLKLSEKWSDLGDYYMALRYICQLIDSGYTNAMNEVIGMEMMINYYKLENKYAMDFIRQGKNA